MLIENIIIKLSPCIEKMLFLKQNYQYYRKFYIIFRLEYDGNPVSKTEDVKKERNFAA